MIGVLRKVSEELYDLSVEVAILMEDYDTGVWDKESKWVVADLNALIVLINSANNFSKALIEEFEDGN